MGTPKTDRSDKRETVATPSVNNDSLIASFVGITFHPILLLHESQEFRHRVQDFVRMRIKPWRIPNSTIAMKIFLNIGTGYLVFVSIVDVIHGGDI